MSVKETDTKPTWVDPDDAPELGTEWFQNADQNENGVPIRRGRPKLERPKRQLNLRIDADVVDRFKSGGPGWQSRINEALRKAAGL
ncbi:BrnA antitoxin family protein [Phyllobacterium sp. P5_D12]